MYKLWNYVVFDERNLCDPAVLAWHGLGHVSIGRQPVEASGRRNLLLPFNPGGPASLGAGA